MNNVDRTWFEIEPDYGREKFWVKDLELIGRYKLGVIIRCRCVATNDDANYAFILGKNLLLLNHREHVYESKQAGFSYCSPSGISLLDESENLPIGKHFCRASALLPSEMLAWSEDLREYELDL